MKLNNRGYTLIELIATVIVLALVTSIAAYSITAIMKRSKDEIYNKLIKDIKDASELYYQECKYAKTDSITCNYNNNTLTATLGDLVSYGYLTGNKTDSNDQYTVEDPRNNTDISACAISIELVNNNISVTSITQGSSCPTEY